MTTSTDCDCSCASCTLATTQFWLMYDDAYEHNAVVHTFDGVKQLIEECKPDTAAMNQYRILQERKRLDILGMFLAAKYCGNTVRRVLNIIDVNLLAKIAAAKVVADADQRHYDYARINSDGN